MEGLRIRLRWVLTINIFLVVLTASAQVHEIDTVVIRARPAVARLAEQPFAEPLAILPATSIINREEIRMQGALTIIDALSHVPGGLTETRGRQVKQ